MIYFVFVSYWIIIVFLFSFLFFPFRPFFVLSWRYFSCSAICFRRFLYPRIVLRFWLIRILCNSSSVIKRWGWVKNSEFQIRLDWQCCQMSRKLNHLIPTSSGLGIHLRDFMSLCGPCNRYLCLGVVRIKTLHPYSGSWCTYIWYWCPPFLCRVFISPTIK